LAKLSREGDELVVELSNVEKAEAAHGDVKVPVSSVRAVDVVDDAVHAVPGLKVIGAGWPGRFAIGTFSGGPDHMKTFAVVHHDHPRGVRVRLEGERFDQLVISCEDPEALVGQLGSLG
jgi:Bacterial PH domain